jgi:hypothetical protein
VSNYRTLLSMIHVFTSNSHELNLPVDRIKHFPSFIITFAIVSQ